MNIASVGIGKSVAQGVPAKTVNGNKVSFKSTPFEDFDKIDFSNIRKVDTVICMPPKIGLGRLLLGRLTQEQIDAINITGELPQNAKFKENAMGQIGITWNIADITEGTHKLPKGYEVKNDKFGFTHVVREGTKSIFMK